MRILLAEDDPSIAGAICASLRHGGHAVDHVASGNLADAALRDHDYDLLVLDLGLPALDGSEVLRRLRSRGTVMPVLVVTARDGLPERIRVLDLGADDYLVKPFALPELAARCRALIRRATAAANEIVVGGLRIDLAGRRALNEKGEVLELTRREWSILECLAHHSGRVVSKERLTQAITGWSEDISGNAIEVHVSRLRSKLGTSATVRGIRGLGYRLEDG